MLESFKKNRTGIMLMVCSSFFSCTGQLCWKLSASHGLFAMAVGFCIYGAGAFCMLMAYRFGRLSVLQPILGMGYVFSIVFGKMVLNESVTVFKIIGISAIMCGVILVAGGDER